MSDNVCGTNDFHINAYIKQSGRVMFPPMNLPSECGEPPKDLAEAEVCYHIDVMRDGGGSVVLKGYEAVLGAICILRDALQRDVVLKGIRRPSRDELKELAAVVDKIECCIPYESEQK